MDDALIDPDLTAPEVTRFVASVGDVRIGGGTLTLYNDGEHELVQKASGAVYGRITAAAETRFRRHGGVLLAAEHAITVLNGGRPLTHDSSFRDVHVRAPVGIESVGFPRTLVPAPALALALRTLPLAENARFVPQLWLAAIVHWPVDIWVEEREEITVPAGTFDAWRVQLRCNFDDVARAIGELIASLVPPVTAHVATDPTGRLLRASFPTGPVPTDPRVVIEASEIA